jgi:AcrR family transcriptional regulator
VDILNAATSAFLRYGFRKTSMDDVARSAGFSRQGLYLHFANKELLFAGVVEHLVGATLRAARSAMSDEGEPIGDRLHNAFLAMFSLGEKHGGTANFNELLATAAELVPEALERLEVELTHALASALKSSGVVERWKALHLTPRALAENLLAASNGLKHARVSSETYGERMRIAVAITCVDSVPAKKPGAKNKPRTGSA